MSSFSGVRRQALRAGDGKEGRLDGCQRRSEPLLPLTEQLTMLVDELEDQGVELLVT